MGALARLLYHRLAVQSRCGGRLPGRPEAIWTRPAGESDRLSLSKGPPSVGARVAPTLFSKSESPLPTRKYALRGEWLVQDADRGQRKNRTLAANVYHQAAPR